MASQNHSKALRPRRNLGSRIKRRNVILLGVLVSFVALLVAWQLHQHGRLSHSSNATSSTLETHSSKEATEQTREPLVPVVSVTVQKRDVPVYFNGIGTVQAYNTVMVTSRVTGQITRVVFKEGQQVKAGDLLAIVDPRHTKHHWIKRLRRRPRTWPQLANARALYERDNYLLTKRVLAPQDSDNQKQRLAMGSSLNKQQNFRTFTPSFLARAL